MAASTVISHPDQHSPSQIALMKALDFDADDLALNRAGSLSDRQFKNLERVSLIVYLLLCSGGLIMILVTALHLSTNMILICLPATLLYLVYLIVLGVSMRSGIGRLRQTRTVDSVRGRVTRRYFYQFGRHGSWQYRVGIPGLEFKISHETFKAFVVGDEYVLYALPSTESLISAEHIPS